MYNNIDIFTKALGIESPWQLDRVEFDKEKGRLDLFISYEKGTEFPCKKCEQKSSIYDTTDKRTWRHLNFFQYEAYIHCEIPRIDCDEHGVLQVEVPWSRPRSGFTLLFEAFVIELVSAMSVKEAADLVGEHDTRLWRVVKYYVEKARREEDFSEVKDVGIDETSCKKGHNYVTLFVDLSQGKTLYVTEGKDALTIDEFVLSLKAHNGDINNIENVCCDMSPAYIKGAKRNFPNAKLTYDKFHVMKKINEAVDEVRREERKENEELNKTRYIWLKNYENLTKKQEKKYRSLKDKNLKTVRAYNMKLALKDFWDIEDITDASVYLQKWYLWARKSRLEPMKEAGAFIKRNWRGIIQYTQTRINNGILEGINSVIQTVKRKARGFRNVDNFITAIYLRCGKLEFDLPEV